MAKSDVTVLVKVPDLLLMDLHTDWLQVEQVQNGSWQGQGFFFALLS
jgi:hypothetical protein